VCNPPLAIHQHRRTGQAGGFLLEALVALLIFSFGLLAMAGLHARAVHHFNDAQYRANAAELVHGTIGAMRGTDPTTLAIRFDSSSRGAGWLALIEQAKRLPGVSDAQNIPTLQITNGPTTGSRAVLLEVLWQAPADALVHRYAASAVIGANR